VSGGYDLSASELASCDSDIAYRQVVLPNFVVHPTVVWLSVQTVLPNVGVHRVVWASSAVEKRLVSNVIKTIAFMNINLLLNGQMGRVLNITGRACRPSAQGHTTSARSLFRSQRKFGDNACRQAVDLSKLLGIQSSGTGPMIIDKGAHFWTACTVAPHD
jgi:hypothetical protein